MGTILITGNAKKLDGLPVDLDGMQPGDVPQFDGVKLVAVPVGGGFVFVDSWDANANSPDLTVLSPPNGNFYEVSVAGATALPGAPGPWGIGDWVVSRGDGTWWKRDNPANVTSFAGRQGAVSPADGDYTAGQTVFTPNGNIAANRVQDAVVEVRDDAATANGVVAGNLAAHTGNMSNPHGVTAVQAGADPAGTAAAAVLAHEGELDPHPQYLAESEADALYDPLGAGDAAVAAHVGELDPHTQYVDFTDLAYVQDILERQQDADQGLFGVDYAATVNIPGTVSTNTFAGDTFTTTATGQQQLDGQNIGNGDIVLLPVQTTTNQAYLWKVLSGGTPGLPAVFRRWLQVGVASQFITVRKGMEVFIRKGNTLKGLRFLAGLDEGTPGVDAMTWIKTAPIVQAIGDGIAVSFPITHNFGKTPVRVIVYETSTKIQVIPGPTITFTSDNVVTLLFAVAPLLNFYTVEVAR